MPKEWTDKIKAQEEQKKLEAEKIDNLPKQQQQQQKDIDIEPTLNVGLLYECYSNVPSD